MDALDANAIAGLLFEAFGREMTTAIGVCGSCATRSHLAELKVYAGGPGAVARCRHCAKVLMVLVEKRGVMCIDATGLAALQPAN